MKKTVALIFSAVMLISAVFCFDITAFADTQESIDKTQLGSSNVYYEYDCVTKTLTVSGSGSVPNLTNSGTGSSPQPWFSWRADGSIEKVVVEEGITTLGNYCFYGVSAKDIILPSTLNRIGSYALACNGALENIDIGNVTTISNNAFYSCNSLAEIVIPKTVTYIGAGAFENCTSLSSVQFESMKVSVTLSTGAFLNCTSLKNMDIPRYASLNRYSVGYQKASSGDIFEDFTMGVFRDSPAYEYAVKYFLGHRLLNSMVIEEGDEISCSYYDDSLDESISYYFTPQTSCQYIFSSSGEVDVDCVLKNADGEIIASATDNSDEDLNFTLCAQLNAGETYAFTVSGVHSTGDYVLTLLSSQLAGVSISWNINFNAVDVSSGSLEIAEIIAGMSVDFAYESGYVYNMPFNEGASYRGMELHYCGDLNNTVTCGNNVDYITVGDESLEFVIRIEHSYESTVVEPTVKNGGYTIHTCVLCADRYTSDFVPNLGTDVYGYVRVIDSPNGEALENSFIPYAKIYNNEGEYVGCSDENGFFYVEYAYDYLTFVSPFGNSRTVKIEKDKNELGDISMVYCDFNGDGYVNAKDFSILTTAFGEYDETDEILKSLDINCNGEIDYTDWEYALNFVTYGKLTESVYGN